MLDISQDRNGAARRAKFTPSIVYSRPLTQIIQEYQDVCDQLCKIADEVPESTDNIDAMIERERDLFDQHARLLNDAMTRKIRSMEDAKAILTLWKNEVVGDQKHKSLSAGDQIVLSVAKYLEGC
jgi:hypothetical protein